MLVTPGWASNPNLRTGIITIFHRRTPIQSARPYCEVDQGRRTAIQEKARGSLTMVHKLDAGAPSFSPRVVAASSTPPPQVHQQHRLSPQTSRSSPGRPRVLASSRPSNTTRCAGRNSSSNLNPNPRTNSTTTRGRGGHRGDKWEHKSTKGSISVTNIESRNGSEQGGSQGHEQGGENTGRG
ncbi:unnamed protein product, partial [Discosporangium mesarthrocarpum]